MNKRKCFFFGTHFSKLRWTHAEGGWESSKKVNEEANLGI